MPQPTALDSDVTGVTADDFAARAEMRALRAAGVRRIAVAVSGGPDSMALLALTCAWADSSGPAPGVEVHAITIDHALRAESAQEAAQVGAWIKAHFPDVTHHIIRRDSSLITPTRLQEQAREDRYRLMAEACAAHEISHLLLAHHRDDQAETFLMRLCKGSGLDGLAGMKAQSILRGGLQLLRPLLSFDKAQLVQSCVVQGVPYVSDPSNRNDKFARVRLRGLRAALAREGLSVRRLAATASRMARAREALEFFAAQAWDAARVDEMPDAEAPSSGRLPALAFDLAVLQAWPEDMRVRVLARALAEVGYHHTGYGPRLEQVEMLAQQVFGVTPLHESGGDSGFFRTTLHQCIVERSSARGRLWIRAERSLT